MFGSTSTARMQPNSHVLLRKMPLVGFQCVIAVPALMLSAKTGTSHELPVLLAGTAAPFTPAPSARRALMPMHSLPSFPCALHPHAPAPSAPSAPCPPALSTDAGPEDEWLVQEERLGSVVASLKRQFGLDYVYCWHGLPAYWCAAGVCKGWDRVMGRRGFLHDVATPLPAGVRPRGMVRVAGMLALSCCLSATALLRGKDLTCLQPTLSVTCCAPQGGCDAGLPTAVAPCTARDLRRAYPRSLGG